jgi:hypothetical protein
MTIMPLCKNCVEQQTKSRNDSPHADLVPVRSREIKGSGMYGGGGAETVYSCRACGAEVEHSSDKLDYPCYWTVRERKGT